MTPEETLDVMLVGIGPREAHEFDVRALAEQIYVRNAVGETRRLTIPERVERYSALLFGAFEQAEAFVGHAEEKLVRARARDQEEANGDAKV